MYLYIKKTIEIILGINRVTELSLNRDLVSGHTLYIDKTVNFTLFRER